MKNSTSHVCIARIVAAHGIKGQVKIKSFTENPKDIVKYGDVSDERGTKYKITIKSANNDMLIAAIEGIADRNQAELLSGRNLFIERANLPKLEGAHYQADIIGLEVHNNGSVIGSVLAMHNFGAGDILEVKFSDRKTTEMYIFDKNTFPEVNIKEGYIVLNLPEEIVVDK